MEKSTSTEKVLWPILSFYRLWIFWGHEEQPLDRAFVRIAHLASVRLPASLIYFPWRFYRVWANQGASLELPIIDVLPFCWNPTHLLFLPKKYLYIRLGYWESSRALCQSTLRGFTLQTLAHHNHHWSEHVWWRPHYRAIKWTYYEPFWSLWNINRSRPIIILPEGYWWNSILPQLWLVHQWAQLYCLCP